MGVGIGIDWSDTKPGNVNFDVIRKLMGLDTETNRVNRMGLFGGWNFEQDPETGQWTQRQVLDPAMQTAKDRMNWRLQGGGFTPMEMPAQMNSMTDALMADKMMRQGLLDPNQTKWSLAQEDYGTRFGHRHGGGYQSQWEDFGNFVRNGPRPENNPWAGSSPPVHPRLNPEQPPTDPGDGGGGGGGGGGDGGTPPGSGGGPPGGGDAGDRPPTGGGGLKPGRPVLRPKSGGGSYLEGSGQDQIVQALAGQTLQGGANPVVDNPSYDAPNTVPISDLPDNYTNRFYPEVGGHFTQLRDNPAYANTGTSAANVPTNEQGQVYSPLLGWVTPKAPINTTY